MRYAVPPAAHGRFAEGFLNGEPEEEKAKPKKGRKKLKKEEREKRARAAIALPKDPPVCRLLTVSILAGTLARLDRDAPHWKKPHLGQKEDQVVPQS